MSFRRLVICVGGAGLGAFVLLDALRGVGVRVAYPLVLALLLAAVALVLIGVRVEAHGRPDSLDHNPWVESAYPEPDDGVAFAVGQWVGLLEDGHDPLRVHPLIVEMVDQRLRLAHNVDRVLDPGRAASLVGPLLWRYVNETPTRRPTPAELGSLLAELERV